jgi:hypothetical protein
MVFLSGYEFTEGSQCASSQDVGTWNQTIVLSSRPIVNRQLKKKFIVKFQILDTFVLTEDSGARLAIGKGVYGKCDVPRSVLNNLELEYSRPLL